VSGDAELKILLNPAGSGADGGADFLARCFGTRWTRPMYRWYLQRPFLGEPPDRLMLVEGERVVAGCGLAYRLLRTPDALVHRVSVVVAAATLPGERGRGCYARVLRAAAERSALRGCTALLGFVTADNATGRGLRRLGATAVPSAYIVSPGIARLHENGLLRVCGAKVTRRWSEGAGTRWRRAPLQASFHYPAASEWRAQMVERPHPVLALRVGATCRALVECVGDTDRLQWLDCEARERVAAIRAIAAHAQRRRRRFFMYSTCPDEVAAAQRLGLCVRPGFMMALAPTSRQESTVHGWAALPWHVQSGDRL
jgi:hypothetical protein